MIEPTKEQLEAWKGAVIKEKPYVKLLTAPTLYEEEVLPGVVKSEYRALAQVDDALCVISVRVVPLPPTDGGSRP